MDSSWAPTIGNNIPYCSLATSKMVMVCDGGWWGGSNHRSPEEIGQPQKGVPWVGVHEKSSGEGFEVFVDVCCFFSGECKKDVHVM